MESPKTLQEAIQFFSEFENCRQFMILVRWSDGKVRCPLCGSEKVTYLEKARLYRCYSDHARQKFSLKVGTVFEDSPVPLEKWLPALWLMVACKNGVSSYEIHRALGVTQKTAWFMLHRIRLAMQSGGFGRMTKIGDGGEGNTAVEVDETFVGGKMKNMHRDRRARFQAEKSAAKTVVIGMLDRSAREVRAKVVPNVKRETLQTEILKNVKFGSTVYTDDAVPYDRMNWHYVHDVVNHAETYVRGQVHTNGLENFWSLLKRTLRGTYVAVEPFHLDRYIDEQAFRFNNRGNKEKPMTDADRFSKALSQIVGKRLTFAEVTGKVGETSF
jgi:transposase-like protein